MKPKFKIGDVIERIGETLNSGVVDPHTFKVTGYNNNTYRFRNKWGRRVRYERSWVDRKYMLSPEWVAEKIHKMIEEGEK